MTTCAVCDWHIDDELDTGQYMLCGVCQAEQSSEYDRNTRQAHINGEWIVGNGSGGIVQILFSFCYESYIN